ncbi:MAG: hypothetical protein L0Z73_01515 [Gammaproteobacteria bacterium]|nr:hypothetical protein [Gammaproteobacteria bacterium]
MSVTFGVHHLLSTMGLFDDTVFIDILFIDTLFIDMVFIDIVFTGTLAKGD